MRNVKYQKNKGWLIKNVYTSVVTDIF